MSPVTEEDATSVRIYLPDDLFYDFDKRVPVRSHGEWVDIKDVPYDRIPLHIRGGCVIPLKMESANTTTELRKKAFEILVAPGLDGSATGSLYVDDGESLDGGLFRTEVTWVYSGGQLSATTSRGEEVNFAEIGVKVEKITILGQGEEDGGSREEL